MHEHTRDQQVVNAAPEMPPPATESSPEGSAPPPWAHPAWAPPVGGWAPPPKRPPNWIERLGLRVYGLLERPAWLAPFAVLACVSAAFAYVLAFDPTDSRPDALGPCAFKYLTGLDCPGCGGTRMVWFLLHADIPQAARHHIMALIAVPALGYAYVSWVANRLTRWRLPVWKPSGKLLAAYGVGWLVFVIARNLPWEPFSFLYV